MNVSKSLPDSPSPFKPLRDRLATTVVDLPRSGIRDFFDIVSQMKEVISLGVGEPDFTTPWHIREGAMYSLEQGQTGYTSNLGMPKLRKAISGYVERTFGPSYNPDREILITVGVSEALDLAIRALCNPGDEVIYHEPCYVSYRPLITLAHAKPVILETSAGDNFRVTAERLRPLITDRTKLLILNFPNNPTGGGLSAEDVKGIAELAVEKDLIVITDEIYAELTYDRPHVSIAAMPGMRDRTIFLHGFSKALAMTGWRIGFACAPPELTEAMMKIHQYTMLCAPVMSQEAAYEALRHPERDIQEMKESYWRRRNFLHASFVSMGLNCQKPEGAFYMFPEIRGFGITAKEFAIKLLEQEQVAAVPGTAFGVCGEGHLRCCYATSMDQLKVAVTRIERFIGGLK
ncbi:MAG: aminotransferase class I/II-fold pyridoxal phosphate-dependent enzyme [Verrucomicrobia bacterium]|nr:aminotransferase class I/II-fold pyridoxal phosphate-dependent enzyme [Verrucomicrobiota bacterium]MCH8526082.1 aminotransferase class I/II-fold pyridoxal phosphate-dependent enzyme [Kiritimatiellia bacterium]